MVCAQKPLRSARNGAKRVGWLARIVVSTNRHPRAVMRFRAAETEACAGDLAAAGRDAPGAAAAVLPT
jgi:hypothetical protein